MMCKIFSGDKEYVEKMINDLLNSSNNIKLTDIRYSTSVNLGCIVHSAILIYNYGGF